MFTNCGEVHSAVAERLGWFLHFAEGRSVSRTCRAFNISRTTFYRWAERFDPMDLSSLEDRPTRPDVAGAPMALASGAFVSDAGTETPARAEGVFHPASSHMWLQCRAPRLDGRAGKRAAVCASLITNIAVIAMLLLSAL